MNSKHIYCLPQYNPDFPLGEISNEVEVMYSKKESYICITDYQCYPKYVVASEKIVKSDDKLAFYFAFKLIKNL
jgi:hypothetical protein